MFHNTFIYRYLLVIDTKLQLLFRCVLHNSIDQNIDVEDFLWYNQS